MNRFSGRVSGLRGKLAEQAAAKYLRQQGCKIIEQNFRCRLGEIDIIIRDGRFLAFVEVRCRQHKGFGSAAESVTHQKQQRLLATARFYLAGHPGQELPCRMDVIEATPVDDHHWQFNWLKNAFQE